jgi:hypothetical protein
MERILVRGGHVVDPANGVDGPADVRIADGRIVETGEGLARAAEQVVDATGKAVLPGLVDLHVHVSSEHAGTVAHGMLARAGVTTALDLSGPVGDVVGLAARHGAGLTLGCVERLLPDRHLPAHPTVTEIRAALDRVTVSGALGVKLHVDSGWSPAATADIIEETGRRHLWVAVHCGTSETASDIRGFSEALELAGGAPIHVAHVNSYCRGDVALPLDEARQAIEVLRSARHVVSESYLASINGTSAACVDGAPRNPRVRGWLRAGGYDGTEEGLRKAILGGYARIPVIRAGDVLLAAGEDGLAAWQAAETRTGLCLPVNPALPRIVLASSRGPTGIFDVDALATDGGGIPRNVTFRAGTSLVEWGAISLPDLVLKASTTPARALGLTRKGHLGIGADADVIVADPERGRIDVTIAGGRIVMRNGEVRTGPTTFITTPAGRGAVLEAGTVPIVRDCPAGALRERSFRGTGRGAGRQRA